MSKNEKLYESAIEAVNRLFSDQSVPQSEARKNLRALRGEIDILLDTLNTEVISS